MAKAWCVSMNRKPIDITFEREGVSKVSASVLVRCGACPCSAFKTGSPAQFKQQAAEQTIAAFRAQGWRIDGDNVLCPNCSKNQPAAE